MSDCPGIDVVAIGALNDDLKIEDGTDRPEFEPDYEVGIANDADMEARLRKISWRGVGWGGSGFNVIHALAQMRVGLDLGFVGVEGHKKRDFGLGSAHLKSLGVDIDEITGAPDVYPGRSLSPRGPEPRGLHTSPGANALLAARLVDERNRLLEYCAGARTVHVTSFVDVETTIAAADFLSALKERAPTVLIAVDPGSIWAEPDSPELGRAVDRLLGASDLLFATGREFTSLVSRFSRKGEPGSAAAMRLQADLAARSRRDRGPTIVVKQPARVELFDPEGEAPVWISAPRQTSVDDTGAGDVLAAGYLAARALGVPSEWFRLTLGAAVARISVEGEGSAAYPRFATTTHRYFRRMYAAEGRPRSAYPAWLRALPTSGSRPEVTVIGAAVADVQAGNNLPHRRVVPERSKRSDKTLERLETTGVIELETGITHKADSAALLAGGKGLIQAVGAARLGASVTLISALGDDDLGIEIQHVLHEEGVALQPEPEPGCATPIAIVLTATAGTSYVTTQAVREVAKLRSPMTTSITRCLQTADVILATLEAPARAREELTEVLEDRAKGGRAVISVLRASPRYSPVTEAPSKKLLGAFDYIVARPADLPTLFPGHAVTEEVADSSLIELWETNHRVIVTLGGAGYAYVADGEVVRQGALSAVPRDSTGTSDAFCAALGVGLGLGLSLADALERANAAGAWAVETPGGFASMPTERQLAAFRNERPSSRRVTTSEDTEVEV